MHEIVNVTTEGIVLFLLFMAMYQLGEIIMKLILLFIDATKALFCKIFKIHSPSKMWMETVNSNWED